MVQGVARWPLAVARQSQTRPCLERHYWRGCRRCHSSQRRIAAVAVCKHSICGAPGSPAGSPSRSRCDWAAESRHGADGRCNPAARKSNRTRHCSWQQGPSAPLLQPSPICLCWQKALKSLAYARVRRRDATWVVDHVQLPLRQTLAEVLPASMAGGHRRHCGPARGSLATVGTPRNPQERQAVQTQQTRAR